MITKGSKIAILYTNVKKNNDDHQEHHITFYKMIFS